MQRTLISVEILAAMLAARPAHMIKREQTRQRVTASVDEIFTAGTYAAREQGST